MATGNGYAGVLETDIIQGFAALLEPFYGGKSLTDPINTAEVRYNRKFCKIGVDLLAGQMESSTSILESQRPCQATYRFI
jgi:hypothetical protein